ncbi:hypothetical protein [Metabacillus iocasae]|uniref:Uncharacterized protein n=1 Tax=Priestia iocasae TaxID=2291674 RepID=A0ABS2R149_9BACI|nr:hypothetical protein [Metabacillus iocasae]MBM7704731.1 hypothetical protein [Metabacillus iocasae]
MIDTLLFLIGVGTVIFFAFGLLFRKYKRANKNQNTTVDYVDDEHDHDEFDDSSSYTSWSDEASGNDDNNSN